jgi:hypothetical protein
MWRLFEAATLLGRKSIDEEAARRAFPERMAEPSLAPPDRAALDQLLRGRDAETERSREAGG